MSALKSLLQENPHCFVLFPIHHVDIWQMYKKTEASFWMVEEIDVSADSQIGTGCLKLNTTSSPMSLCSLLPPMALSTRTWAAFYLQSNGAQSLMLLRLPNHSQKHPQLNVLPPHWHVHQGSNRKSAPVSHHQNSAMRSIQSQLGSQMVQLHQCQLFWTNDCIQHCWRHLLLKLLGMVHA